MGDPESILTPDDLQEDQETLLLRTSSGLPSSIETALTHYADSLVHLVANNSTASIDPYTRGFVAGIRAAAKVAANASDDSVDLSVFVGLDD